MKEIIKSSVEKFRFTDLSRLINSCMEKVKARLNSFGYEFDWTFELSLLLFLIKLKLNTVLLHDFLLLFRSCLNNCILLRIWIKFHLFDIFSRFSLFYFFLGIQPGELVKCSLFSTSSWLAFLFCSLYNSNCTFLDIFRA